MDYREIEKIIKKHLQEHEEELVRKGAIPSKADPSNLFLVVNLDLGLFVMPVVFSTS